MIKKHGALLSIHTKQMKLIVDEWGCWYDVEPGTNPGFLFQQNTMRDAIVAAINLNIFNQHSDIVCMANIAQAVNVLQSLILTEGEKMVKTPTYHVFDMFKEHQGNDLVDSFVENEVREGVPAISYSASMNEDRDLVITFANCMLDETYEVSCDLCGYNAKTIDAQILTNEVHAHNDFTDPEKVSIVPYKATKDGDKIIVSLPPCSVVTVICHE